MHAFYTAIYSKHLENKFHTQLLSKTSIANMIIKANDYGAISNDSDTIVLFWCRMKLVQCYKTLLTNITTSK